MPDALFPRATRRTVLIGAATAAAIVGSGNWIDAAQAGPLRAIKRTEEFGQNGGNDFAMEYPQSIGLRQSGVVQALILNGTLHGDGGGDFIGEFELTGDDYWSDFEVHSGNVVDYLYVRSASGNELRAGGNGGDGRRMKIQGARITRIGGRTDNENLSHIRIEFVENYRKSVEELPEAYAILDFRNSSTRYETYTKESLRLAQAYERVISHTSEFSLSASAEADYYGKFSMTTGFKTTDSSQESIKASTDKALESGEKTTETLDADHIAVLISAIKVMKDEDGNYWIIPTAEANWTILKNNKADLKVLIGHFDLTSGFADLTGLHHETQYKLRRIIL